jgi:hypothetical protein
VVNRSGKDQLYQLTIEPKDTVTMEVMAPEKLSMKSGQSNLIPISIAFPASLTGQGGRADLKLIITDSDQSSVTVDCHLLGPKQ